MKKIILTSVTVLFMTLGAQAQSNDGSTATFGFKGGVNFSNINANDVDDNNVLTGFAVGAFVNLPINSLLSIQPEFLYSRKGASLNYESFLATGESKFKLDYLEVPLLLKINILKNFSVHAGPYVAYLIEPSITNETESGDFEFDESFDNDDLNKLDYGLSAGFGFDFDRFFFGARYNQGMRTIGKERDFAGTTYTIPDGKNSNVSVYLGIQF